MSANSNIASAIVSVLVLGITMPYSLLGISSATPPTSVITAAVSLAAASSSDVENPSERVGRQNISADVRRDAMNFGQVYPQDERCLARCLEFRFLMDRRLQ